MLEILDIDGMRTAGKVASDILDKIGEIIQPNISTMDINNYGEKLMDEVGAISGSLGYYGFPGVLCTSINDVVCHGIPSGSVVLKSGDFINVDVALKFNGYYGDTSRCFPVGKVLPKTKELIYTTYEAMWAAIEQCKPGMCVNNIGIIIENRIKKTNFSIVKRFCGHGIGKNMHEDPEVPHYYEPGCTAILREGMAITIEPMINGSKNYNCRILSDGWTAKTIDGNMSAQWEHTIYITNNGCEVMTYNNYDKEKNKPQVIC